jgi:hypothetical protein
LKPDLHDCLKRVCSPATSDEAVGRMTESPVTTTRSRPAEARVDVWARLGLALKNWAAAAE